MKPKLTLLDARSGSDRLLAPAARMLVAPLHLAFEIVHARITIPLRQRRWVAIRRMRVRLAHESKVDAEAILLDGTFPQANGRYRRHPCPRRRDRVYPARSRRSKPPPQPIFRLPHSVIATAQEPRLRRRTAENYRVRSESHVDQFRKGYVPARTWED
jgi:hypothetical protein